MRDIAITLIAFGAAIYALRRPHVGILLWTWISVMNPHRNAWGFAYSFPFAQLAAAATFIGMVTGRDKIRMPFSAPVLLLLLLLAWMGLTTFLAIIPGESNYMFWRVFKIMLMIFVSAAIIREERHVELMVWTIVLSLGYYGLKGGVFTVTGGGANRVWGPPDSFVEGNNELALAIIITIPLMYFLTTRVQRKWIKYGLYAGMVLCTFSAIGSQSRGALLAISAMAFALWTRSRNKFAFSMGLVLLIPAVLALMPESWYERMNTIKTYEEDASAKGRLNAWSMAINIAKDRITGAGFATAAPVIYQQYAPDPSYVIVAHSIYFQVLGEHGFTGLAIYLAFWMSTYLLAMRISKRAQYYPALTWCADLARMIRVSLIGFFVGGAFLSLAYWDVPFYLMVLLVAMNELVRQEEAAAARGQRRQQAAPPRHTTAAASAAQQPDLRRTG
jgi:probable O-glycosylation ligase (exosortase A-associated)